MGGAGVMVHLHATIPGDLLADTIARLVAHRRVWVIDAGWGMHRRALPYWMGLGGWGEA